MLPPTATRTARPRQPVVNQSDCTVGYSVHISTSWSCHSIPPAGCEKMKSVAAPGVWCPARTAHAAHSSFGGRVGYRVPRGTGDERQRTDSGYCRGLRLRTTEQ